MKWFNLAGVVMASLTLSAVSASPVAAADSCKAACTKTYQTCLKGKATDACLPKWGTCKRKCNPKPAMQPTSSTTPGSTVYQMQTQAGPTTQAGAAATTRTAAKTR